MSEYGELLVCPRCGCGNFSQVAMAAIIRSLQYFEPAPDEIVLVEDEWEVGEVLEEQHEFCDDCGQKPDEGGLIEASKFTPPPLEEDKPMKFGIFSRKK